MDRGRGQSGEVHQEARAEGLIRGAEKFRVRYVCGTLIQLFPLCNKYDTLYTI